MGKTQQDSSSRYCDLVMEGGGVKGVGLVGALSVLAEHDYKFHRVAGTSAGAIVGALTAAGMSVTKMRELLETLDYRNFQDEGFLDKFGLAGKTVSLVVERGIYEGKFLQAWLAEQLRELGVETFGDLKLKDEWAQALPPEQRYKLVVITSDISNGRMVRLPWDYAKYGLDADKQLVADAVRASMSIPFFFEPAKLDGNFMVDGGLLSNFPINLFDDTPIWPTFGIKLTAKPDTNEPKYETKNIVEFAQAIVGTAMNGHDQMHLEDPMTLARTMFVDTMDIKATNFAINKEQQQKLYLNGREGARKFLETWNFSKFGKEFPFKAVRK